MLLNECFHKKVNVIKKHHSCPVSNVLFLRHVIKHTNKIKSLSICLYKHNFNNYCWYNLLSLIFFIKIYQNYLSFVPVVANKVFFSQQKYLTCVFTFFVYTKKNILNQTSAIKQNFYSRGILHSTFLSSTSY